MEAGAPPDGLTNRQVLVRQHVTVLPPGRGFRVGRWGVRKASWKVIEPGLRQREQGLVMSRQRALKAEGTVQAWSSTGPVRQEHSEQGQ